MIAHASVRFSGLNQVSAHPFSEGVRWKDSVKAPFVPALDSEIDMGYYDDLTSPENLTECPEERGESEGKGGPSSEEGSGLAYVRREWTGRMVEDTSGRSAIPPNIYRDADGSLQPAYLTRPV